MQEQLILRLSRCFGARNSAVQITQDILEHLSYDERTSTLDILKFKTAVHRFVNANKLIVFYINNYATCICAGYFWPGLNQNKSWRTSASITFSSQRWLWNRLIFKGKI